MLHVLLHLFVNYRPIASVILVSLVLLFLVRIYIERVRDKFR